jgi:hypothetical protein
MSITVVAIDLLGLVFVAGGFLMSFRQHVVRNALSWWKPESALLAHRDPAGQDPIAYILRIFGVMLMAFGAVVAISITLINIGP